MPIQALENRIDFLERHYTVGELARGWHLAAGTVRRWFENEPGVIRVGEQRLRKGKTRAYVSLRVPESVAQRVYRRRTQAA